MRFESVAGCGGGGAGHRSSFVQGEARLGGGKTTSFGDWKLGETIGPNRGTIPIVGGDDFSHIRTTSPDDDEIFFFFSNIVVNFNEWLLRIVTRRKKKSSERKIWLM